MGQAGRRLLGVLVGGAIQNRGRIEDDQVGGEAGPDLSKLAFVARAITPPYRPRRFDARFFLADAEAVLVHDDPVAGEELLHTRWFSLEEAEALDLPSITRFVLKEVRARLAGEVVAPPFLRWSRGTHSLERLTS